MKTRMDREPDRSTLDFFSSRRRNTKLDCDWSSDVCSSDLGAANEGCQPRWTGYWPRPPPLIPAKGPAETAPAPMRVRFPVTGFRLGCGLSWRRGTRIAEDRKSTRLNSSHSQISYAVFCLKK